MIGNIKKESELKLQTIRCLRYKNGMEFFYHLKLSHAKLSSWPGGRQEMPVSG